MREIIATFRERLYPLEQRLKSKINKSLNLYLLTLLILQASAAGLLIWYNSQQTKILTIYLCIFLLVTGLVIRKLFNATTISYKHLSFRFSKRSLRRSLIITIHAVVIGLSGGYLFSLINGQFPHGLSPLHVLRCQSTPTADIPYFLYSVPLQVVFFFGSTLLVILVKESMWNRTRSNTETLLIQVTAVMSFGFVHATFSAESAIFAGMTLGISHYYAMFLRRDIIAAILTHGILGSYAISNAWVVNGHICQLY